jgi:hypothetical protein
MVAAEGSGLLARHSMEYYFSLLPVSPSHQTFPSAPTLHWRWATWVSIVTHILPAEFRNPSWASLLEVRARARLGNTALCRDLPPTEAVQRISILGIWPPLLLEKCAFWIWNCSPTVLVCSPCESVSSAPSRYSQTHVSTWSDIETWMDILIAASLWLHSASNRNEFQKQKNNVSGE